MHHDARMYIEVRYDGESADVCIVLFRDRGVLGIQCETTEYTCDSHELTDDLWHEATMNLYNALESIQKRRK